VFSGLPTFDADFHEAEDGARLTLHRADLLGGQPFGWWLRKGDVVQLWDEESGYCLGRVERVRGDSIAVEPLWPHWSPAPVVEIADAPTAAPRAWIPSNLGTIRPKVGAILSSGLT